LAKTTKNPGRQTWVFDLKNEDKLPAFASNLRSGVGGIGLTILRVRQKTIGYRSAWCRRSGEGLSAGYAGSGYGGGTRHAGDTTRVASYRAALFGSGALGGSGPSVGSGNSLVGSGALGGESGGFLSLVVYVLAHAIANAGAGCAAYQAAHGTVALIDEGTAQDAGRAANGGAFALWAPAALGLGLVARKEAEQQHRNEEQPGSTFHGKWQWETERRER
jgi:hypothetical protein